LPWLFIVQLRSGEPYWLACDQSLAEEPVYKPLNGDARCEVLILGGGITGALVAHQLVKRGIDTLLVDKGELASGSTAASTGLLQYEVDTHLHDLIGKVGLEQAVHAYRRCRTAIDEIEALTVELGDDCGFSRRDSLYFASAWWHQRSLRRECACRIEFGFDVEWLSRARLREVSTIHAAGSILSHNDAQLDPYRFTRRLLEDAVLRGLRAYCQTEVTKVEEGKHEVVVATKTGRIRANHIVYATGYATGPFLSDSRGALHSTYAVASEPMASFPGWPSECLIWETARPYFYARQTSDGRALIGGADTSFSNDHRRDALVERKVRRLVHRFHILFPQASFVPEFAWAGTFADTKDGLAYIGQYPERPRAYFALGYGGNGITYGMIAAKLIADLIAGQPNADAAVFRFER
jgi:glycine/D-amino acid oxidase-like deaminating enzyme